MRPLMLSTTPGFSFGLRKSRDGPEWVDCFPNPVVGTTHQFHGILHLVDGGDDLVKA